MARAVVRTTRNRHLLDEWSLVLTAAGIEHQLGGGGGYHTLVVADAAAPSAVDALSGYDKERSRRGAEEWIESTTGSQVPWLVSIAILIGYLYTGPVVVGSVAFDRGAAIATGIRSGELWRLATALTLHADALHALSNALSALVFLIPLCRILGGGTSLALSLGAGMAATWINTLLRGSAYAGIGASTAVFAAVGLLAGTRGGRARGTPRWRRLGPFGAALGILAMLGAAPRTDVIAHLLGLAVGTVAGSLFAHVRRAASPPGADGALGMAAVGVIIGAWTAAWLLA